MQLSLSSSCRCYNYSNFYKAAVVCGSAVGTGWSGWLATLHVVRKDCCSSEPSSHVPVGGVGLIWGASGPRAVALPL
eukprot:349785-Chlamydomonas_euryale.AAC.14